MRSYGRNIAVNVWWDHDRSLDMDLNVCKDVQFDTSLTMENIKLQGFGGEDNLDLRQIRYYIYWSAFVGKNISRYLFLFVSMIKPAL